MINTPRYLKLARSLQEKIFAGAYPVGTLLPSENALGKKFYLARSMVRLALSRLESGGLIEKHQGRGSLVVEQKLGLGILSLEGTTQSLGRRISTRVVKPPASGQWPEPFYFPLEEDIKKPGCIFLARVRLVEFRPLIYEETHLTNRNLEALCKMDLNNRSLFDILKKRHGIEVAGGQQKIMALKAPQDIARMLKMPPSAPLLHVQRKLLTNVRGLALFSSLYCNTENHCLLGAF